MHGYIRRRLAWTLALALACGAGAAHGQQYVTQAMPDPAGSPEAQAPVYQQVAAMQVDDTAKLAADVAELKKQIKDMKDKEAAAKAKAALEPSVKVGGRLQWDTDTFSQNATSLTTVGDALNGTEFRRVYLTLIGSAFETLDYKAEVDLVPGHVSWRDVYLQMHDLPVVQNIRVGHFFTPFGLETETSDLNTVFTERSIIDYLGGIGNRHAGAMIFGNALNERSWWGCGAFATQRNDAPPTFPVTGFDDDGGVAIYGRTTFLPWYDEATNGRGLWHVGISGMTGDLPHIRTAGTTRFSISAKPEVNLAPVVVNTGDMADAEIVNAVNAETAFVYGSFSVQAEYEWIRVNRSAAADPTFNGGYLFFSYFLTGENRVYNKKTGTFARVVPYENFFRVRDEDGCVQMGKGAWEVGYRCSYLDLNDSGVLGGRVVDHTFGVNWYWNPYTKLMLDVIHSEASDMLKGNVYYTDKSVLNALVTRVQIDF
jgi:phosphate-selective porin OprO/OprP